MMRTKLERRSLLATILHAAQALWMRRLMARSHWVNYILKCSFVHAATTSRCPPKSKDRFRLFLPIPPTRRRNRRKRTDRSVHILPTSLSPSSRSQRRKDEEGCYGGRDRGGRLGDRGAKLTDCVRSSVTAAQRPLRSTVWRYVENGQLCSMRR